MGVMRHALAACILALQVQSACAQAPPALATEVRGKGWIVFSARSPQNDWDLFACRPDGTDARNLTRTPDTHEFYPLFSRDGTRLLFRRLPKTEVIDGNRYGAQGTLMLAAADGSNPQALGAHPWASWGADGREVATLSLKGVEIVDIASGKVTRTLQRKGFFQQLTWSPDGAALVGVSNSFGTAWAVGRMLKTGETNAVSSVDCCTPDWFPDSRRIVYSCRPPAAGGKSHEWTQLWAADADGNNRRLLYAEDGRHLYGGHVSPDGKYLLFTGNVQEDGDPQRRGAAMSLIRLADTPMVAGEAQSKKHPDARRGPLLALPEGYEPAWTSHDIFRTPAAGKASP